jgi:hypothetical protein
MQIIYLPIAAREHDEKLDRIAARPFTTHSVKDFLDDIALLEAEIRNRPGQRRVFGAPSGWFRVGPSRIYSYSLIYRLDGETAYIVATAAPARRPFFWLRRKV